jgi:hypothetical protein
MGLEMGLGLGLFDGVGVTTKLGALLGVLLGLGLGLFDGLGVTTKLGALLGLGVGFCVGESVRGTCSKTQIPTITPLHAYTDWSSSPSKVNNAKGNSLSNGRAPIANAEGT